MSEIKIPKAWIEACNSQFRSADDLTWAISGLTSFFSTAAKKMSSKTWEGRLAWGMRTFWMARLAFSKSFSLLYWMSRSSQPLILASSGSILLVWVTGSASALCSDGREEGAAWVGAVAWSLQNHFKILRQKSQTKGVWLVPFWVEGQRDNLYKDLYP